VVTLAQAPYADTGPGATVGRVSEMCTVCGLLRRCCAQSVDGAPHAAATQIGCWLLGARVAGLLRVDITNQKSFIEVKGG
jgi:hypothetical protein